VDWTEISQLSFQLWHYWGVWTQIRNYQISNRNLHHRIYHHVQGLPWQIHVPTVLKSGSLNLPEPSVPIISLHSVQVVSTRFFRFFTIQLRPGLSMFSYFSYYHSQSILTNLFIHSFSSCGTGLFDSHFVVKYTNLLLQLLFGLNTSFYYLQQHFRSRHSGYPLVHCGARTPIAMFVKPSSSLLA
jgi:hypothetical protein